MFVDYDAQPPVFQLMPRAQEATPLVAVSSVSCKGDLSPSDKGLIAVGSVLGALIAGLLAYVLYRFWVLAKARIQSSPNPPTTSPPGNEGGTTPHMGGVTGIPQTLSPLGSPLVPATQPGVNLEATALT